MLELVRLQKAMPLLWGAILIGCSCLICEFPSPVCLSPFSRLLIFCNHVRNIEIVMVSIVMVSIVTVSIVTVSIVMVSIVFAIVQFI